MAGTYFYPKLTEELAYRAGLEPSNYELCYKAEGSWHALEYEGRKTKERLTDPDGMLDASLDTILVEKKLFIDYPGELFGPNGIAPDGAELSACILWSCPKLSTAGVIEPSRVIENETVLCSFSHEFEPGEIDGELVLDLQLYLMEPADFLGEGEAWLQNESGVLLGSIEGQRHYFLDDEYMDFPISEVDEPGKPLWRMVFYDWEDPREDPFSEESFELLLNRAHPDCPAIAAAGVNNMAMLAELLATAYLLIFERVRSFEGGSAWKDTMNATNCSKGSISSVLNWFSKGLPDREFDWSTSEGMLYDIKSIVEAKLNGKGGDDE